MKLIAPQPALATQVHDAVLEAICSGALAPGERVTQEDLATRFGVSRQPVLQALMLLRQGGFVVDAGRKGVMVAPLDAAFVRNIYGVRAALDGAAGRMAATNANATTVETGRRLVERGRATLGDDNTRRTIEADIRFHQWLYDASGNPLIGETAALHLRHVRRIMGAVLWTVATDVNAIWDEHAAICEAIAARDPDLAERLARRHAEDAAIDLATRLQTPAALAAA